MTDQKIKNPRIKQGWLRVLVFGAAFIIITLLVAIPAVLLLAGVKQDDLENHLIPTLAAQLSSDHLWLMVILEFIISLITVGLFRLFIDRKSLGSLGLQPDGYGTEALIGFLIGPALLGISALLLLLTGHLHWVDITFDANALFISFGLLILIAFSEELVFRGYILGNLLETFENKWIALIISAVLFAAFHVTNPNINSLAFFNLFLAGLLLGLNYIWTKNLYFSFLFHLSWNFFQGPVFGFRVSGLSLPTLLQTELKGDQLITGGDFGLEGSILSMAVLLTAFFILAWAFQNKYSDINTPSSAPSPAKA